MVRRHLLVYASLSSASRDSCGLSADRAVKLIPLHDKAELPQSVPFAPLDLVTVRGREINARASFSMPITLTRFLETYPPHLENHEAIDGAAMAASIRSSFGVAVPDDMICFWNTVGAGYFGERELYFFGAVDTGPRPSIIDWNRQDFWDTLLTTPPWDGGMFFFGETCQGLQLALLQDERSFGAEQNSLVCCLFDVDTMRVYRVADSFRELMEDILVSRFAIVDEDLFMELSRRLGSLPAGMHYAPIISPILGGTLDPSNFHLETPNVHLQTTAAAWLARNGQR